MVVASDLNNLTASVPRSRRQALNSEWARGSFADARRPRGPPALAPRSASTVPTTGASSAARAGELKTPNCDRNQLVGICVDKARCLWLAAEGSEALGLGGQLLPVSATARGRAPGYNTCVSS